MVRGKQLGFECSITEQLRVLFAGEIVTLTEAERAIETDSSGVSCAVQIPPCTSSSAEQGLEWSRGVCL